jgi:hypothetical protein
MTQLRGGINSRTQSDFHGLVAEQITLAPKRIIALRMNDSRDAGRRGMSGLRSLTADDEAAPTICGRCRATGCPWDRIGGVSVCPDCQELMIRGEGEPLRLHSQPHRCAACGNSGTLPFVTVPLRARPVVIDLCALHLRELLGRRLEPEAFLELARQLLELQLVPGRIFLLHEAFYDRQGQALQPVAEAS